MSKSIKVFPLSITGEELIGVNLINSLSFIHNARQPGVDNFCSFFKIVPGNKIYSS